MNSVLYETDNQGVHENVHNTKKYRFSNAPTDFINNEMWRLVIMEVIDICVATKGQQNEIDNMYNKFCCVV
jgi:hypothetical protein